MHDKKRDDEETRKEVLEFDNVTSLWDTVS